MWSLGRLMLEMTEPWNTILPDFEAGDTLKFANPKDWSLEARDFLRNTSTVLAEDLTDVCILSVFNEVWLIFWLAWILAEGGP
jgi:hypothetical protein